MRFEGTEEAKKSEKLSWSKKLVRKWLSIKSKPKGAGDHEETVNCSVHKEATTKNCNSGYSPSHEKPSNGSYDGVCQRNVDSDAPKAVGIQEYKIFVSTWNVGGRSPPSHLNMENWLHTSPPADIYVLGFQEIVPLNAGNVLVSEDNGPAKKWVALISKTLNDLPGGSNSYHAPSPPCDPIVELSSDFEGSSSRQKASSLFARRSFHSFGQNCNVDGGMVPPRPSFGCRFSISDQVILGSRPCDGDASCRWAGSSDDDNIDDDSPSSEFSLPTYGNNIPSCIDGRDGSPGHTRYSLVASKQMVGIFLAIWALNEIKDGINNIKVSCIGRGLMGYLGNKGSISISMSLHQTTFCFICSHLTSGQKEGDELRRNADVMEILRKTRFPKVNGQGAGKSPSTILEHDRIIWLGDLNYRIALSYRAAKALVEMHNWKVLLENDQLRMEQRRGHVFNGWQEGRIYFAPTYKYSNNSDRYAGDEMNPKAKRRTPAWCDRILWHGMGLDQLAYVRGESRFSDHRPVYGIFTAMVESNDCSRKRGLNCSSSRIAAEELLPCLDGYFELGFV